MGLTMAKKDDAKGTTERHKKLLIRIHERYKLMTEADHENRRQAKEDMKFLHVPGEQWDENQKKRRGKRPCYEFNLTATRVKRVINDLRANRPQGKVRAVEDGDKDTAEVYEGLIRNIWNVSHGDSAVDYAAEYQVGGGMGAWRVETKYSRDTAFDQDIVVTPFKNPFSVYADPSCSDMMKRDAMDWIVVDRISKAEYERRWPKAKRVSFDASEMDDDEDWQDEDGVRVCEYWYKEPVNKTLYLLKDGTTVDVAPSDPSTIARTRDVRTYQIKNCIASGDAILEEGDWAGSKFPFVIVYGSWIIIDGKPRWYGLTRNGKDAQRSYNVAHTSVVETIAAAPKAKYWASTKQAEGMLDQWRRADDENIPAMLYNPDPAVGGTPQRMGGADVPTALMSQLQIAEQALNGVMGVHEASLGERGDEKSGRAIVARQRQGEITNFNFSDNLANGIQLTWEIIVDLIPKIITNERAMRVLGADGAEKYIKVNSVELDPVSMTMLPKNDVTRGIYDVVITVGPSYATKRMEAVDTMTQLAQAYPALMQVAGDIMVKNMDIPGADALSDRLKALLPPQIQQQLQAENAGKPLPPEVMAAMQQVEQMSQMVEQQGQMVQQAQAEAQKDINAAGKAKADLQVQAANLKVQEAEIERQVAEFKALVAETQASMAQQQAGDMSAEAQQMLAQQAAERENMLREVAAAQEQIQQRVAEMLNAYAAHSEQMMAQMAPKPRGARTITTSRKNGQVVAQIADEATGEVQTIPFQRGPGGLTARIDPNAVPDEQRLN